MKYLALQPIQERSDWPWVEFRRVASIRREVNRSGDRPLLALSAATGIQRRPDGGGRQPASDETISKYWVVRPNWLVFNPMWAIEGGVAVSQSEGAVSTAYRVYMLHSSLHARFAHYYLRSDPALEQYRLMIRGVTTFDRSITRSDFEAMPVPAPPISEQQTIADYLDAETARTDALIAKKHMLVQLLEEHIDSIVFDGIRGRLTSSGSTVIPSGIDWLGNIPQHFETPWLGAHHTTQLGKMLNANAASGPEQYPYIKNTNVKWDHFDLEDLPTMTFDADDRHRCALRPGDVVVCEGGEVGRSAVWSRHDEIFFQKALHRVRPVTKNVPRFLMYCLWAAAKLNVFAVEGNQSTIVHLTGEKLREHRFPWPPLDEQYRIVSLIDTERERVDQAVKRLERQVLLLSERQRALITSVITGEMPVPEAAA